MRFSQRVFRELSLPIFQPLQDVLIGCRLWIEHPCLIHLDLCHVEWLQIQIPIGSLDTFLLWKDLGDYRGRMMLYIPSLYSIWRDQIMFFVPIMHNVGHVLI